MELTVTGRKFAITDWMKEYCPIGCFILMLIVLVLKVAWMAFKFYQNHFVKPAEDRETLSDKFNKLPCKKHEEEYSDIKCELKYIRGSLDAIRYSSQSTDLAQAHSPLSLTEKGINAANKIGADRMIDENWNRISNLLKKEISDKNAYDIQQYCIRTAAIELDKLIGEDGVRKMKDFAYAEGKSLQDVSIIIALKVRDRFFKENDINVLEVDKNDPTRK